MKEQQKSSAQIALERIMSAPKDPRYIEVPDLPIPTAYGVLIKPLEEESKDIIITDSNIIISAAAAKSSPTGILCAVGPNCSPWMRVGMRVRYSHHITDRFYHLGVEYMQGDEGGVLYIVPHQSTHAVGQPRTGAMKRKEDKLANQKRIDLMDTKNYLNERDKREDKTKGKIRKVK